MEETYLGKGKRGNKLYRVSNSEYTAVVDSNGSMPRCWRRAYEEVRGPDYIEFLNIIERFKYPRQYTV